MSYDKSIPLMTSAEILLGSEQAAAALGGSLQASLHHSGITLAQCTTGEGFIPLHKLIAFLNHAAEHFDCGHFGLLIAKHQPPARFALIGQLIRFAPTLGAAIEDAISFSLLNSEFTQWELERHEDSVSLIRHTRLSYDAPMIQLKTLAMAVVYKAMNAVCGKRVPVRQVNFAIAPPAEPERWEHFFGARVLFNQPRTSIELPLGAMSMPVPTADARVRELLQAHLRNLAEGQSADADMVERVRFQIRRTVGSRRCNLEGICHIWGIHPRALQRTLRDHHTNFREILLDVRQELAEEYLRNSSIAVNELSDILGYSNASAFSRVFKQRVGVAPDAWRSQHLPPSASRKKVRALS